MSNSFAENQIARNIYALLDADYDTITGTGFEKNTRACYFKLFSNGLEFEAGALDTKRMRIELVSDGSYTMHVTGLEQIDMPRDDEDNAAYDLRRQNRRVLYKNVIASISADKLLTTFYSIV